MKTIIKLSFLLSFFLLTSISNAQISEQIKREVESRITSGDNPSIAIGFYKNNTVDYFVSGYQNIEKKTPASTATIYEIGSITKTFTGLLFSKMNLENKVSLSTPLYTVFPDSLKLSDPEGRKITFKHVATHTSGLQSFPMGYYPPDPKNPYAQLDRAKIYQYLKNWRIAKVGGTFSYSNIGVELMGEGLALLEGTPYTTLITNEILNPLKLDHTYFNVPISQNKYVADGYQNGKNTSHWDLNILSPAGALRADIRDLLSYGISYLKENPISKAQQGTIPTQFVSEDGKMEIGINWFKKGTTIYHGGGTYGFSAYLVIDLENKVVVAVLTNTGDQNVSDIHNYLLDPKNSRLFKKEEDILIDLPLNILKTYEGVYSDLESGLEITFKRKNFKLYGQDKGQQQFLFEAIAKNIFINKKDKAMITFEAKDKEITGITLNQAGQNIALKKQNI